MSKEGGDNKKREGRQRGRREGRGRDGCATQMSHVNAALLLCGDCVLGAPTSRSTGCTNSNNNNNNAYDKNRQPTKFVLHFVQMTVKSNMDPKTLLYYCTMKYRRCEFLFWDTLYYAAWLVRPHAALRTYAGRRMIPYMNNHYLGM